MDIFWPPKQFFSLLDLVRATLADSVGRGANQLDGVGMCKYYTRLSGYEDVDQKITEKVLWTDAKIPPECN